MTVLMISSSGTKGDGPYLEHVITLFVCHFYVGQVQLK